jgi:ubiquinone/menaquinone biosynthesis C-methylase UbiE
MEAGKAYAKWAEQYDTNENKTRDLEAKALREILSAIHFENCLEIGCGTGKNTEWLIQKAKQLTAVDLSEEMLAKARQKTHRAQVEFHIADITRPWTFTDGLYDLVTFSLVLEHIENLDQIFNKVADVLIQGGYVYVGELHPFKQYSGSKARFETEEGLQIVDCYNHHVSDFTNAAKKHGLIIADLKEYFDEDNRLQVPRILSLLFQKP